MGTLHTSHIDSKAHREWDRAAGRPPTHTSMPCASCRYPVGADGVEVIDGVGFCRECVIYSHPGPQAEIGVVD